MCYQKKDNFIDITQTDQYQFQMSYMKQIQTLIRQNETMKKQMKQIKIQRVQLMTLISEFILSIYPQIKYEQTNQNSKISKQKEAQEQQQGEFRIRIANNILKMKGKSFNQFSQQIAEYKIRIMKIRKKNVLDLLNMQYQKSGIQNIEQQMLNKRNQFRDQSDPLTISNMIQIIKSSTYQLLNKIEQEKQSNQILNEQIEKYVQQHQFLKLGLNDSQLVIKKMQYKIQDLETEIYQLSNKLELELSQRQKIQKSQKRWKSRFETLQTEYYQMQQSHNQIISEVMSVGAKIIQKQ